MDDKHREEMLDKIIEIGGLCAELDLEPSFTKAKDFAIASFALNWSNDQLKQAMKDQWDNLKIH